MSNKILEELTKEASTGDLVRGSFSPAWMEEHIATKHGAKGPEGIKANVKSHVKGTLRSAGRGVAEGVGGATIAATIGAGVSTLLKKGDPKAAAAAASKIGYYAGGIHGALKSLSNQSKEMNKKYSEKKASYDALVEQGTSFEDAIKMVKEAGMAGSAVTALKAAGRAIKGDAGKLSGQLKNVQLAAKNNGVFTKGTASTLKAVAGNKAVQAGAAGVAAAGLTGAAMAGEKRAALEALLDAGIDFDQAIDLVKEASEKVYGAQ